MNARYNMNTPEEAARVIGTTSVTISNWCRHGKINCRNVSDGKHKGRYEIEDAEVNYLKKLVEQHGVLNAMKYYSKEWKSGVVVVPQKDIKDPLPDGEYTGAWTAKYLGIEKSSVNKWCREDKINHRDEVNKEGRGDVHIIPGWEVIYIKSLFDKYGKGSGKNATMLLHYKKNRGDRDMGEGLPWTLDMDTEVPEKPQILTADDVKAQYAKATEPEVVTNKILDELGGVKSFTEPSDDKLLDDFIRLRELKRDIEKYETKLNQMKHEYTELKKEVTEWL